MRTINIFLASSDELMNDRNSFQALIASLDDIFERRGIRIKCQRLRLCVRSECTKQCNCGCFFKN